MNNAFNHIQPRLLRLHIYLREMCRISHMKWTSLHAGPKKQEKRPGQFWWEQSMCQVIAGPFRILQSWLRILVSDPPKKRQKPWNEKLSSWNKRCVFINWSLLAERQRISLPETYWGPTLSRRAIGYKPQLRSWVVAVIRTELTEHSRTKPANPWLLSFREHPICWLRQGGVSPLKQVTNKPSPVMSDQITSHYVLIGGRRRQALRWC